MIIRKQYTTFLYLEDGSCYQGWSFHNNSQSIGEVVFNTGMTGYQEVMTDPSYYSQIILFTYPEIGNTGINILDIESSRIAVSGIIFKSLCIKPSNWRSEISLVDYLILNNISHIFGIDTRFLTKNLRDKGVMVGYISTYQLNKQDFSSAIKSFQSSISIHAVDSVSTKKKYEWLPRSLDGLIAPFYRQISQRSKSLRVVVIDYGVKFNILNRLKFYGCKVIIMPAQTSYRSITVLEPDGILLSNGPGDPALIDLKSIHMIKSLVNSNFPIFGICLGHQLLSLAMGAQTNKLKFGHRGLNHPSGLYNIMKMTSQNHGYVVSIHTIPMTLIHICAFNGNDTTISGIVHKKKPCFSVQYHPEASPGPHDSDFLFAHFIKVMQYCKHD